MSRGTLFRSPLLTLGSVAAPGIACEWTIDLAPIGEREIVPGQRVELHAAIEAAAGEPATDAPIAFDVLPADPSGEPAGAPLVRLLGTGATAPAGTPGEPRTTVRRELEPGQDVAASRAAFAAEHPSDLTEQLLVVREPGPPARTHAITWWPVTPGESRTLHFAVDVGGLPAGARTARAMRVSSATAAGVGTVEFELRFEDGGPMPDAELEVAFEGGVRSRATTDARGHASVAIPPGAAAVFRVFLLSYVEGVGAPRPVPAPPEPDDPIPPAQADTRPEVVAAFAFNSSFPAPIVHASLVRVEAKARLAADTKLIVFGHTDQVGTDAYNLTLSDRRAHAVLALLLDDRDMFDAVAANEGWDTKVHQSMLRGIGCNPGGIDGDVGPMTRAATLSFQREYNAGVYHERAMVERERSTLPTDGNLSPATREAIRDAYVAVAPHVPADHFADPHFAGCGEAHPISTSDDDNRRAVVAFLAADPDPAQGTPCERYDELVGETPEDRRGLHFADYQWLAEESGAIHLSAATVAPDGAAARIRVVRCEGPVPMPPPDSSQDGAEPPVLGPQLADLAAKVQGGICHARWTNPDAGVLDPETWMLDHDVQVEIVDPADHAAPADDDPASSTAIMAADAMHPPVFVAQAGAKWSVSGPPGQRLNRVRVAPDVTEGGVALRNDGSILVYATERGLVGGGPAVDVISLALAEHELTPAGTNGAGVAG